MLGTRKSEGVTIDLWVGAPSYFYCDESFMFEKDEASFADFAPQSPVSEKNLMNVEYVSSYEQITESLGAHILSAENLSGDEGSANKRTIRHVAVVPNLQESEDAFFKVLSSKLLFVIKDLSSNDRPRLTIILPDIATHERYYEVFSATFPEETPEGLQP